MAATNNPYPTDKIVTTSTHTDDKPNKEKDPRAKRLTREKIMGAVARGWCHEKNEKKTMDEDLALAITDEIMQSLPDV